MIFYNRQQELQQLRTIAARAQHSAQMTFLVGRRRIGKTRLIQEAFKDRTFVYWFVARKSETLLCEEFVEQLKAVLNIPVFGDIKRFSQVFELLLNHSREHSFTLVIDEFQEFLHINPSIYSDIQNLWDQYTMQHDCSINLVLSGSIYSLMTRLFENAKESLYGRADHKLILQPLNADTLQTIYRENVPTFKSQDFLAFYSITGGVPRYVETLVDRQAFSLDAILDVVLEQSSIFLHEGRDLLLDEFGKDYGVYFSILALIASSKTSRQAIESILGTTVGGYLERLENHFNIIKKIRPVLAKPQSRTQKYVIDDHFLNFWFRFIYKHQSALEIGNYDYVKNIIKEDFPAFSGYCLEHYFKEQLQLSQQYSVMGSYWEKDHQNEIDIVALNERQKTALIAEVKRSSQRLNLDTLKSKADKLCRQLSDYTITFKGYSLDDIY